MNRISLQIAILRARNIIRCAHSRVKHLAVSVSTEVSRAIYLLTQVGLSLIAATKVCQTMAHEARNS